MCSDHLQEAEKGGNKSICLRGTGRLQKHCLDECQRILLCIGYHRSGFSACSERRPSKKIKRVPSPGPCFTRPAESWERTGLRPVIAFHSINLKSAGTFSGLQQRLTHLMIKHQTHTHTHTPWAAEHRSMLTLG